MTLDDKIKAFLSVNSGYGSGYGSGSGYGDGYGDGSGDGSGYGYGDGSGSWPPRFAMVTVPIFRRIGFSSMTLTA